MIQNPGFEDNPPSNLGNNIGHPITPWIIGGGSQSNVVKVDGPGGYNYGNLGPEFDATAPGAGTAQHYLDIANGENKFYQSFTVPACPAAPEGTTAKVTFGGYFSGRGNAGGSATISLLNGTGFNGAVITTLNATVAPGNSQTTPWIHVTGTATITFGATFSYVVDMPNPLNFDNAYLIIESNPCLAKLTIRKNVVGAGANFAFTTAGTGLSNFSLTVPGNGTATQVFNNLTPGVFSVSEGLVAGYTLTSITCVGDTDNGNTINLGGRTATIDLDAGEDQICTFTNTKTETPPNPEGESCLKGAKVDVKCNSDGTYTITLNGIPVTGNDISLTSQTAGITITPSQQPWSSTTTWTVAGAKPGAVIKLMANVTQIGGGSRPDTDLCCSGEIEVTMPDCPEVGTLIVKKQIDTKPGPVLFPPMTFPVTVTCGSTVTNLTLASDGTPQTVGNIPVGTSCTVIENTSAIVTPPGYCRPPAVAMWTPSYTPAGPYLISTTPFTVTVHNSFECTNNTGSIIVKKEVIANSPVPVPAMTFPATVTCGTAPPVAISLPSNGTPVTVNNMPLGSTCTVVEGAPSVSNACPRPLVDSWSTAYVPVSATVANPPNTITVRNTLDCKRNEIGSIIVRKEVTGPAGMVTPAMTFPVTVACGSLITNLNLASNGAPQTVSNIPAGTSCTVSEGTFTSPPGLCQEPAGTAYWTTTLIPPGAVMPATPPPVVTVRNSFTCANIKPAGQITVTKLVRSSNPEFPAPAMTFPINVTCFGGPVINLAAGGSRTLTGAIGTSCNFFEPPPSTAGSTCPANHTPSWTTNYSPSTTAVFATPPSVVTVTNTFHCTPAIDKPAVLPLVPPLPPGSQVCAPPKVPGPVRGQCVCPQGTTLRGASCVAIERPKVCPPSYIRNASNECICPRGTEDRGGRCVPQLVCRSPMVPNSRGNACICPAGLVSNGRTCIRPLSCEAPARPNRAGTACVCPAGTVARGNTCIVRERPRIECRPPARLNARGNACIAPVDPRGRRDPRLDPGRGFPQIQVVPGFGGPRGGPRDGGPRRPGGDGIGRPGAGRP